MNTQEQDEKAQEIADSLSRYLNTGGDKETLARNLIRDHRTLVQQMFSVFMSVCKLMSAEYKLGQYDLRNEDSCKIADEICEKIPNRHVRFI